METLKIILIVMIVAILSSCNKSTEGKDGAAEAGSVFFNAWLNDLIGNEETINVAKSDTATTLDLLKVTDLKKEF